MSRQTLARKPRCLYTVTSLLVGTLLITGCSSRNGLPFAMKRAVVPKTEIIPIDAGNISIKPPPGFCKDERASKSTETAVFLIFANCGYINSNGWRASNSATFSGLVTTSVAKTAAFKNPRDITIMSDYLSSHDGLKSLSTSNDAKSVSIVDKRQTEDGVFLQIKDNDAELTKTVWKSFLNRSDHLVTVTLLQDKKILLEPEQAMQFLQSYSETIKANSEQTAVTSLDSFQPALRPTPVVVPVDNKNSLKKVGFLRRLLL